MTTDPEPEKELAQALGQWIDHVMARQSGHPSESPAAEPSDSYEWDWAFADQPIETLDELIEFLGEMLHGRASEHRRRFYGWAPTFPHRMVRAYPGRDRPPLRWAPDHEDYPVRCILCGREDSLDALQENCPARKPINTS